MWSLVNSTPYAAARCFARDRNGVETWVVVVKATFVIGSRGVPALATSQPEVLLTPVYRGAPGSSSLLREAELAPAKPATDLLVLGHAHAPRDRPVTEIDVAVEVGSWSRRLRVFGNRIWRARLGHATPSAPEPFTRIALTWENAYGGIDFDADPSGQVRERCNPVGVGFARDARHLDGRRVPNVEDPDALLSSGNRRPRPAGLGPIARDWSPRIELGGTYDRQWEEEQRPLPPADFDDRFYQCAPEQQQLTGLRGGEPVRLVNLTPDGVRTFALPRIALGFRTHIGRRTVHHPAHLDAVIIEPEPSLVTLVYGTRVPCHGEDHKVEQTVIWEKGIA